MKEKLIFGTLAIAAVQFLQSIDDLSELILRLFHNGPQISPNWGRGRSPAEPMWAAWIVAILDT